MPNVLAQAMANAMPSEKSLNVEHIGRLRLTEQVLAVGRLWPNPGSRNVIVGVPWNPASGTLDAPLAKIKISSSFMLSTFPSKIKQKTKQKCTLLEQ